VTARSCEESGTRQGHKGKDLMESSAGSEGSRKGLIKEHFKQGPKLRAWALGKHKRGGTVVLVGAWRQQLHLTGRDEHFGRQHL